MEINSMVAQEIVEKLKSVVKQDLNFMNKKSIIIASTDPKRIGDYHEGAEITIASGKEISINFDEEYKGSKQGINLPIFFEGKVVGVIGITGNKSEVLVYGEVIKELTEILLYQNYINKQKQFYAETKRHLIHEILFLNNINYNEVDVFSSMLKINVKKFDIVAIFKMEIKENIKEDKKKDRYDKIFSSLNHALSIYSNVLTTLFNNEVICFFNSEEIENVKVTVSSFMTNNIREKLSFSVGTKKDSLDELKISYGEAKTIQQMTEGSIYNEVVQYDTRNTDIILLEIPEEKRKDFIEKIFGGIPMKKRDEYIECLVAYYKNNKSIKKTAIELFIHENTIQYRIKKVYDYTGLDPRHSLDSFTLQMAIKLTKHI